MNKLAIAGFVALLATSSAHSQFVGNNPGNAPWKAGPAALPKGAKMILVSGDPAKSGPYTVQMRYPAGYKIGPHRYPSEVRFKILNGGLTYGLGTDTRSGVKSLTKGTSGKVPANSYYFASTSVGATLEFTGTGPISVEYARAKDDPRKK
ncbi:MAG TPA: hypothetical protein VFH89_09825 [Sphingomicrobium sp.]|nr:hypothetical protein [Sphingomicrobium sp.]